MTPAELDRLRDELDWAENQEQTAMTDAELDELLVSVKGEASSYTSRDVSALVAELRQTRRRLAEAEQFGKDLDRIAQLMGCSLIPTRPVSCDVEDVLKRLAEAEAKDRESERLCKEMLCRCADGLHALNVLPKTADGVTILPGMKLYPLHPLDPSELDGDEDYAVVEMHAVDPFGGDDIEPDNLHLNYSSKAEAALAAGREGEAK